MTDESVPDSQKDYVLLLNAHPAEPCGQEGMPRFLEDLLIWRDKDPEHVLDDASGLHDQPHKISVAELLRRVKVFFVSPSPDGWAGGDGPGPADNGNAAGFNSNRVAYQDGWVFPATEELYDRGYSSLTQPEGAAVSRYLRQVRDTEIGGRPFAVANDQHGPVPTSGAIIYQTEQGSDPAKVERVHDYGRRLEQNMDEVFAKYFTGEGLNASQQLAREAGNVRDLLLQKYNEQVGSFDEKAAYLTLEWADAATAWEHIDYTVGSSWGGFAGSQSGLGADSIGFETACRPFAAGYDPAMFQLFVDNVRAASETGVVHAAQREGRADPPPVATHDVGGKVGFVETGKRITDSDGNPSPPPLGHPGTPLLEQVAQAPYDVSNTDYFRDLRPIVSNPIVEVPNAGLRRNTQRLSTLVVADTPEVNAAALKRFATGGGNLVLTDAALQLLPRLTDMPQDAVRMRTAYVGYSDLDRSHPWTKDLYLQARQMFDPVGLGYPLLMERDQYWPCETGCDESGTENSAPVWTTDRAAWERQGGDDDRHRRPARRQGAGRGHEHRPHSDRDTAARQGQDRGVRGAAPPADRVLRPLVRREPLHGLHPGPAASAPGPPLERPLVARPADAGALRPARRDLPSAGAARRAAAPRAGLRERQARTRHPRPAATCPRPPASRAARSLHRAHQGGHPQRPPCDRHAPLPGVRPASGARRLTRRPPKGLACPRLLGSEDQGLHWRDGSPEARL